MPQISSSALVLLVQLVDEKIGELERLIQRTPESAEELVDHEDELASCAKVELELKAAYEEAAKTVGNLPRYEELVSRRLSKTVC
jgi:hypothetical protein